MKIEAMGFESINLKNEFMLFSVLGLQVENGIFEKFPIFQTF